MINHYEVLGLAPTASAEEIKTAYRQLAKLHHPDRDGGDAAQFSRIQDAYEVLCDGTRREAFDLDLQHARQARVRFRLRTRGRRPAVGRRAPARSDLTRLISVAIPRAGRFMMEGIVGSIGIEPTTQDNLWETSLKKFGRADTDRLARHVVQLKLVGRREVVEALFPEPAEFGIQFPGKQGRLMQQVFVQRWGTGDAEFGADLLFGRNRSSTTAPALKIQGTVPEGITLQLRGVTGTITLGDLRADLVCSLGAGNVLRSGRLTRAKLTLAGDAMAYLAKMEGDADVVALENSKVLLDGTLPRLRVVVGDQGHVEVLCPVGSLHAEVHGRGFLNAKNSVHDAHCEVHTGGYVRLAQLAQPLQGHCTGGGLVDIVSAGRAGAPA